MPRQPQGLCVPHQEEDWSVAANAQHHGHTLLAKVLGLELGGCEHLPPPTTSCSLAVCGVSLFWAPGIPQSPVRND